MYAHAPSNRMVGSCSSNITTNAKPALLIPNHAGPRWKRTGMWLEQRESEETRCWHHFVEIVVGRFSQMRPSAQNAVRTENQVRQIRQQFSSMRHPLVQARPVS